MVMEKKDSNTTTTQLLKLDTIPPRKSDSKADFKNIAGRNLKMAHSKFRR